MARVSGGLNGQGGGVACGVSVAGEKPFLRLGN